MEAFRDKVAVITGAAGALGVALAKQCAGRGMRLVLADVDGAALAEARRLLGTSVDCAARPTDVRRGDDVEALARFAWERFGGVHLLFNNAGVGLVKPLLDTTANDWRWVLGVNLWGVIHGIAAFLPRMLAQGCESRIVNTASAAGFLSEPAMGAYSVSKHGVVVLSETLRRELAERSSAVGVTVLCPAFFPSGITDSERVRPAELGNATAAAPPSEAAQRLGKAVRSGRQSADDIASRALEAVAAGQFYVFTHKKIRLAIEDRVRDVLAACPYPSTP
jgi:NAD(P)-dependent dehydrogenase (short-subunit alcohol dehydrogenase family)